MASDRLLAVLSCQEVILIALSVNAKRVMVDVDPSTPLLWVLRDILGLTGTKFGCGMAQCGACTVHVDGQAVRSCVTPAASVQGHAVKTIEGLSAPGLSAIQRAWIEEDVVQCGYCQPGRYIAAAAVGAARPHPSDADIDNAMSANLCRC